MNVILAGMPASGKTVISRILGGLLSFEVIDTDEVIVKKHGEINKIFAELGEDYFRNLETRAVEETCKKDNVVISTGGGCLLRKENRDLLKNSGKIVYLRAEAQTLASRARGDTSRPLLKGDVKARIEKLLKERAPVYESAADFTIDVDKLTPREIAEKITELIK